ncbi:DUF397 domain-containing protein [Actinacidiphila bryophytorum]|uniref:DUF397 domain-containing protein n=1 Tax=Actinacidiphila bryophytorum TaxID=1436133 RepID=A0A9W4DYC2_9ACTN|nr:DUF397 domain-containing protein [Actinacidiphila bryophytorum]MBM9436628.1 DUF397 domain-containing protein [Actinacidiphila bryophytorum]MBN6546716.1 DUF397 domain-containing protein [Actinacidiphila bryophytorum]CAG7599149.1 conserved hypothetical protein [Actinacidiphila bryophytorum]
MTLKPSAGAGPRLAWTKSSYSSNDGPDCVEVAWVKSSYSGSDNNDCVEVAASSDAILVRDSKDPQGPRFSFTPEAWASFLAYAATREV